jgi:hypothetical protein
MEFLASLIIIAFGFFNIHIDSIPLSRGEHGLLIVPCSFEIGDYKKYGDCLYDTGANLSGITDKELPNILKNRTVRFKVMTLLSATGESKTYSFEYDKLTSGTLAHKNGQYIFIPMPDNMLGILGSPLVNGRNVIILKNRIIVL